MSKTNSDALLLTLHRHELLLSIGIFGVTQMLADMLADLERGTAAAFIRGIGVLLIIVLLISSLFRRSRARTIACLPSLLLAGARA